jgi:geranylgeranyl diphosphate synthase type II
MISAAYGALADVGEHLSLCALLSHTNEAVSVTIQGQSRDIEAKKNISEREYEDIAAMKSGPLIQLTLALPLLMAGHQDYVPLANSALHKFAIAYQIVDDLHDYQQDSQHGQLNFINVLAAKSSLKEAIYIAQTRTQYLLKQCEKELTSLPNNCAASVIKASEGLLAKTRVAR